jgi:hypothetical protein
MFGFSILYFTAFNVVDKSYRQVLTPVNNSQLLLKLGILDKFRLVTNHKIQHKGNCNIFSSNWYRRNGSSHHLEPQSIDVTTFAACAHNHFHI